MRKTERAVIRFLIKSNLLIGIQGAGYALLVSVLAHIPITFHALFMPFIITFAVYNVDRIIRYDEQADALLHPERLAFADRRRLPVTVITALLLTYGVCYSFYTSVLAGVTFIAPVLLGLLYSVSFIPLGRRILRLKDIPGVKNLVVALCWGIGAGVLPIAVLGVPFTATVWLLIGFVALRMLVNTSFGDCVEMEGDIKEGTKTIPVIVGRKNGFLLVKTMNALVGIFYLIVTLPGLLPPTMHLLNLLSALGVGLALHLSAKPNGTAFGNRYGGFSEGEGIVLGIISLIQLGG